MFRSEALGRSAAQLLPLSSAPGCFRDEQGPWRGSQEQEDARGFWGSLVFWGAGLSQLPSYRRRIMPGDLGMALERGVCSSSHTGGCELQKDFIPLRRPASVTPLEKSHFCPGGHFPTPGYIHGCAYPPAGWHTLCDAREAMTGLCCGWRWAGGKLSLGGCGTGPTAPC